MIRTVSTTLLIDDVPGYPGLFTEHGLSPWIETARGAVLICGCCHSGIVNTLRHVETLKPGVTVRAIIGGLHLLNADNDRLRASLKALAQLSPEKIVPCHCTGDAAIQAMSVSLGKCVIQGTAGMVIEPLKNYCKSR